MRTTVAAAEAGFGSPGETVDHEWAAGGTLTPVRVGGSSARPLDVRRARCAAQVAG
jgi:hypothetical protein